MTVGAQIGSLNKLKLKMPTLAGGLGGGLYVLSRWREQTWTPAHSGMHIIGSPPLIQDNS